MAAGGCGGRFLTRVRGQKASVSKGVGPPACFRYKSAAAAISIMTDRLYFDWNATAPLRPQARAAMLATLDIAGNPSSVHGEGRAARRLLEEARQSVAALVGAEPRNVVLTSGGTEANMLAPATPSDTDGKVRDLHPIQATDHPSTL